LASLGAAATDTTDTAGISGELAASNPLFAVLTPNMYMEQNGQPMLAPGAMVGTANLKDTARVNQYLNRPEVKANIPGNLKFLWSVKPEQRTPNFLSLYAIKTSGPENGAVMTGDVITDARDDFNEHNHPVVSMSMNTEGARQWRKITAEAAQNNR